MGALLWAEAGSRNGQSCEINLLWYMMNTILSLQGQEKRYGLLTIAAMLFTSRSVSAK